MCPSRSAEPPHSTLLTNIFLGTFGIFLQWQLAWRSWNFLLLLGPDPKLVPGTGMMLAQIWPPLKEQCCDFFFLVPPLPFLFLFFLTSCLFPLWFWQPERYCTELAKAQATREGEAEPSEPVSHGQQMVAFWGRG